MKKTLQTSVLALSLFILASTSNASASFFGDPQLGYQSITSDRYGASYFVPANYDSEKAWPLVIVLYSDEAMRGTALINEWVMELKKRNMIGLFVSYLDPRELPFSSDQRILAHLREIQLRYYIDESHILLTAFGDAAHYAFYLGHRYPEQFTAVGLEGAGAEGRFEALMRFERKQAKRLNFLIVIGEQDKTISQEAFLSKHEELKQRGYKIEWVMLKEINHAPNALSRERILDWFSALRSMTNLTTDDSTPLSPTRVVYNLFRGVFGR